MKKILFLIAIVLGLAACNEPWVPAEQETDGPLVTIEFDVQLPEALETKAAWGNTPTITDVWVLEFGAAGYFKRWAQATPTNGHITANGEAGRKTYRVELPMSSAEQRFHIIANPPTTETFIGMTEVEVVNSLQTTNGNCAFWQRIVVPNGIRGTKDGDHYVATAESQAYFSVVPLIRNFAKVIVRSTSGTNTGKILQYALVNVPTSGKVAPYDITGHQYVGPYTDIAHIGDLSFNTLYNNGRGYMPQDVTLKDIATASTTTYSTLTWKTPTSADPYLYMYERPLPTDNPTCVVVQIQDRGWYKIEILAEGKYVPIYRDFTYSINIDAIDGDGEATVAEALAGPAFGDVSASLETESMTTISDGKSRLTVGFTDWVEVSTTAKTVSLSYDFTYPSDATNPRVTVEVQDVSGAVTSVGTVSGTSGTLSVNLAGNTTTSPKKSVVIVSGVTDNYRTLYRKVYFRVVGRLELGNGSISGGSSMGDAVTLTLELPTDLGSSLFPLTLLIEADNNSLSANDSDLPVQIGTSPISNVNTFWFAKTITYSEYYNRSTKVYTTQFPCHFKRNKNVSGTTTITVYDEHGRFGNKEYTL